VPRECHVGSYLQRKISQLTSPHAVGMSDNEDEESVWSLIAADEELRLSRIAAAPAAPAAPAAAQLVVRAAAPAAPAAAQGDHWGGADSTVDSVASWRAFGHHLCLPWALPLSTPARGARML